jgi:hypothetical protein
LKVRDASALPQSFAMWLNHGFFVARGALLQNTLLTPKRAAISMQAQKNEREPNISSTFLHRTDDGMDRPSGKAKRHQHLRRARQAVLYQTLCRPTFEA